MKHLATLAVFYFFANYSGYWGQQLGPYLSQGDCNVVRSQLSARGISVTICWEAR